MLNNEALCARPLKGPLKGTIRVPGDKSISHRAVLFAAMAEGTSHLKGVLDSDDVRSSMAAVEQLGAQVDMKIGMDGMFEGTITGWGAKGPRQPDGPIYCGNSGTTVRLLMGIIAPWDIKVELTGDASLSKRPMRRNTAPLMKMGVTFEPAGAEHLPIVEIGNPDLRAIKYDAPMASAQLKSAVLLAGVFAKGTTTLREPAPSRNHTELMLPDFGVETTAGTCLASVEGPAAMTASDVHVPGDPSSAAFLLAGAILTPGSEVRVEGVSLNPARIGFVRTLERMGAQIEEHIEGHAGKEPYGSITAKYSPNLTGCEVPKQHFASVLDEVPVLALVAASAKGVTVFKGAAELRAKETDRMAVIISEFAKLGINAWEESDNLFIEGNPGYTVPEGVELQSFGDHRFAMTWALCGLCGANAVQVEEFECVSVSYPNFMHDIRKLEK
jgi:3-phosphoshikimate 1-carboxyvinyltransferase